MEGKMKEIWKPVEDSFVVEGKYEVSNLGKIRHTSNGNIVSLNTNIVSDYRVCSLKGSFKPSCVKYVHRLVAIAFLENSDNLPQVGHKDHDKENNCVDNLYWTSQSQNTRDGVEAGRINAKKRGKTNQLTPDQIREVAFKRSGNMGVNDIAISMGLPRTTVSSVINGRSHWSIYCAALKEMEKHECNE